MPFASTSCPRCRGPVIRLMPSFSTRPHDLPTPSTASRFYGCLPDAGATPMSVLAKSGQSRRIAAFDALHRLCHGVCHFVSRRRWYRLGEGNSTLSSLEILIAAVEEKVTGVFFQSRQSELLSPSRLTLPRVPRIRGSYTTPLHGLVVLVVHTKRSGNRLSREAVEIRVRQGPRFLTCRGGS